MTEEKIDLFTTDIGTLYQIVSEENFIKPLNYFFLLALPTIEEKTKGGIILAQQSIDNSSIGNNVGRIVGIGSCIGAGKSNAYDDLLDLKIGDYVGYNPHSGMPQYHADHKFLCIADDGLRTKINDITKHTDGIFKTYSVKGI